MTVLKTSVMNHRIRLGWTAWGRFNTGEKSTCRHEQELKVSFASSNDGWRVMVGRAEMVRYSLVGLESSADGEMPEGLPALR